MNPYFVQIALGMAAVLMFRDRFLKSLAVGFTHYTAQTLLIALAGNGPATGAPRLPLVVQFVFFPITMLPERYDIFIPFGPPLNSGLVALVFFLVLKTLNHTVETPDVRGGAPPSTTFFLNALNVVQPVGLGRVAKQVETAGGSPASRRGLAGNVGRGHNAVDWLHSFRASSTEIESTQDSARYWVSAGKMLWGIWTVTVAARGFLGTKRTIYTLCVVPPDPTGKFAGSSLQAALDGRRIRWVSVSSFTEEDGRALLQFVSNVVQVAPREQWDFLITREVNAGLRHSAPSP